MPPETHIPYETLGRYLGKSIARDERESVERHLKDCEFCRRDLEDAVSWQGQMPAAPRRKVRTLWMIGALLLLTAAAIVFYYARA